MRLFGSIKELVSAVFRKDTYEITLRPNQSTTYTAARDVQLPEQNANSVLVSKDSADILTNKSISGSTNTLSDIPNAALAGSIDATKIGAGSVTNTEFGYLNGVTSSIQTQLGGKAASGANSDITSLSGLTTALSTSQGGTGVNSTATYPSSGVMVTEAGSATLTNKTIDGDNNTIQDLGLSSLKTVLADANKAILRDAAGAVTSALIANANISPTAAIDASKIGAGSVDNTEFGYLNGVTSSIQTQLGGKAASGANSDITSLSGLTTALSISQGGTGQTSASAAINALLPSQTTNFNKYLKTDGTNVSWASASGGAGEINAVLNASGADGTSGWVAGTSHSINTVTGATIPLSPAVPTAFTMSSSAAVAIGSQTSSSGDYYEFTMPPALRNRKLKFEFYYTTPAAADGTWGVAVYNGATKVRLSTDTGATPDTVLPAGVAGGKFTAYFDTDSGTTYRVNFVQRTRTNTNSLWVTNVVVGPGIQPQGAVVGEWQAYTPTWTASTTNPSLGNGTIVGKYRRVGDTLQYNLSLVIGSTTTFGSGTWRLGLPAGLNIDFTKLGESNRDTGNHGSGIVYDSSAGQFKTAMGRADLVPNAIIVSLGESVGNFFVSPTVPWTWAPNDAINITGSVPIAEWAGSGTVQLAQNDVNYYYGTGGTWGTTATVTTGQGPGGVLGGTTTPGSSLFEWTLVPSSPIQTGSIPVLELSVDGKNWGPTGLTAGAATTIENLRFDGTNWIGAGVGVNASGNIVIRWGKYAYGSVGTYTGTWYWRVKVVAPGAAVGFGIVQPGTSAGLVSASGLPGNTTGNAIATGYVGEITAQTNTTAAISATNNTWTATTVTLGTGVWLVTGKAYKLAEGTMTSFTVAATASTASSPTNTDESGSFIIFSGGAYTGVMNSTLNNSTGSIKLWTIQTGTSLGSSNVTIWWKAVRIA